MGKKDNAPFPPLNFIGDYGGGTMFLIMGVMAALLQAEKTGQGDIVDAAIIDGTSSMMGIIYSMHALVARHGVGPGVGQGGVRQHLSRAASAVLPARVRDADR